MALLPGPWAYHGQCATESATSTAAWLLPGDRRGLSAWRVMSCVTVQVSSCTRPLAVGGRRVLRTKGVPVPARVDLMNILVYRVVACHEFDIFSSNHKNKIDLYPYVVS